jgi:Glutaminase
MKFKTKPIYFMRKFSAKSLFSKKVRLSALIYVAAIAGVLVIIDACRKTNNAPAKQTETVRSASAVAPMDVVTVVKMSESGSSATVLFAEREKVYTITDKSMIATLRNAYTTQAPVKIGTDGHEIASVATPAASELQAYQNVRATAFNAAAGTWRTVAPTATAESIDADAMTMIESAARAGASLTPSSSSTTLTAVIPNMVTAQSIFNFLSAQCCAIHGTHTVSPCISFQYVEDGCYARAHKMCWVINNFYHYKTQKVFSFANSGSDVLSVKADKWGGCCINWWYHVAPLVTINTSAGPKAYVFDPAMFNTPVPLASWLSAQQNTTCEGSSRAHVSMYSIQPTSAYEPTSFSGTTFNTDSTYSSTNATLTAYSTLVSCY